MFNKQIADRIREGRRLAGLTQAQAADALAQKLRKDADVKINL